MKKDVKIIALDMDGVINSDELINKWFNDKFLQIENSNQFNSNDYNEIRLEVRKQFAEEFCNSTELVFPELASKIVEICNKTDAYILWSSTWRKLEKYNNIEVAKDMFNRRGLPGDRLIAYTPQLGMSWAGHNRGSEIKMWIKDNDEYNVIKCAVIDDRLDAGYNLPKNAKYFNVNEYSGITDYHVTDIIDYLK